ncbi:MAG: methyl-accepting chemotaxis protein [Alphaproteobacteria bacterium]|nr:methyl-accepting chemotaxis protein [Alphaproteobacteria bacterium]
MPIACAAGIAGLVSAGVASPWLAALVVGSGLALVAVVLTRQVIGAVDALRRIAAGDLTQPAASATFGLAGDLNAVADQMRHVAQDAFRMAQMVDTMPTNVMTADPNTGVITYANATSVDTLSRIEQHLPIKAKDLVGTSIDVFHRHPQHQRSIIADGSRLPWSTRIKVGPETLALRITAIRDQAGAYVAPMLTWSVITREVQVADQFESTVKAVADRVSAAVGDMQQAARVMAGAVEISSREAATVSSASEQATANVQTVATATEELTASIQEIGRQVEESAQMAGDAVGQARVANERITGLAETAQRIGAVVDLINQIAAQTNLLALNATIEAARAGEAGKGFAVVAGEVKNLASQTERATSDIARQVSAIQSETAGVVDTIRDIGSMIERMSGIASGIASAVEEQGAATREISRNIQEAAGGTTQVSRTIADVTTAIARADASSDSVLAVADVLGSEAATLRTEVDTLLTAIRAS